VGPGGLDHITTPSSQVLLDRLREITSKVQPDEAAIASLNPCRWLVCQHGKGRALH
jgi:hypothetical protein